MSKQTKAQRRQHRSKYKPHQGVREMARRLKRGDHKWEKRP